MEAEHCSKGGSQEYFVSGNYNIRTCPKNEWMISVGGDFANADTRHNRRLSTIEELMQKEIVDVAKLTRCEVIAIVLYTGPMVSWCSGYVQRPFDLGSALCLCFPRKISLSIPYRSAPLFLPASPPPLPLLSPPYLLTLAS